MVIETKTNGLLSQLFGEITLWERAKRYHIPEKDEAKGKFSVAGFPVHLVNIIHYSAHDRLKVFDWGKSATQIERFLFAVGIPRLERCTNQSANFKKWMTEATDNEDSQMQALLDTKRFQYRIDDMRLVGGRVDGVGGFSLYALQQDVSAIHDIQVRLGGLQRRGIEVGTLATLAIVFALATDTDHRVVTDKIHNTCRVVVDDFQQRLESWELSLAQD